MKDKLIELGEKTWNLPLKYLHKHFWGKGSISPTKPRHKAIRKVNKKQGGVTLITNFPSHDMVMEIVWKSFFHGFVCFAHKQCTYK